MSITSSPFDDKITWQEVRPTSTTTSSVKVYRQFRSGMLTGKWKEVYPAKDAASNEITVIYHPNKNSSATSSY